MSHPKNKHERLLVGKRKGHKRVGQWVEVGSCYKTIDEVFKAREKFSKQHRNVTKICGRRCCANPRKHEKEVTLKERSFAEKQKLLDFKYEGIDDGKDTSFGRKDTN